MSMLMMIWHWLTAPVPGMEHVNVAFAWLVFFAITALSYVASQFLAAYQYSHQPKPIPSTGTAPVIPKGAAIPIVWGTRRVQPITVWAPPELVKVIPVTTTIKLLFGLVKATAVTAYDYAVTMQQVICWGKLNGGDSIVNMVFGNDKLLSDVDETYDYEGPIPGSGPIDVRFPLMSVGRPPGVPPYTSLSIGPFKFDLENFGGVGEVLLFLPTLYGKDGGIKGADGFGGLVNWYIGSNQYEPNPRMLRELGERCPTYGDIAHIVYDDVIVGRSPTPPLIDVIVQRPPANWIPAAGDTSCNTRLYQGRLFSTHWTNDFWRWRVTDTTATGILYDALTNRNYGKRYPGYRIDEASFRDANYQLQAENLGMSMLVTGGPIKFSDIKEECERTAGLVLRRHPETYQWSVKLIRDEASTPTAYANLREVNDTHLTSLQWSKADPKNTINQVTVYFSNAAKAFNRDDVTVRNDANIAMTGTLRKIEVEYPSVTDRAVALRLAARDLKAGSVPLAKGTGKTTRDLWDAERGDCVRLVSRRHKLTGLVVRIVSVDLGEPGDSEITVELLEDVFRHGDIVVTEDPGEGAPVSPAPVILPRVIAREYIEDGVDKLDITLIDPQHRANEVAFRSQVGGAPPSAWDVVAVGDFLTPVDLSGTYTYTVARSASAPSVIAYRITYNTTLVLTDAFSYAALSTPRIFWRTEIDDTTGVVRVLVDGLDDTGDAVQSVEAWLDSGSHATVAVQTGRGGSVLALPWTVEGVGTMPEGTTAIAHVRLNVLHYEPTIATDVAQAYDDQRSITRPGTSTETLAIVVRDGLGGVEFVRNHAGSQILERA